MTATIVCAVTAKLVLIKICERDGILAIVLRKRASELAFSKLHNNCLHASCFPACSKASSVVPVFKN